MKKILLYLMFGLTSFVANFLIYNVSFVYQATPYLHEEQRVESALLMFKYTIPAYLLAAILFALVFYWLGNRRKPDA